MTHKYINVYLINADPLVVRDGTIVDDGDQFIVIDGDRVSWRINVDQIRYIKITKGDEE